MVSNASDEHICAGGPEFRENLHSLLDESNVVLIGAPCVGKSWELAHAVDSDDEFALVYSSYERDEKTEIAAEFDIDDRVYELDQLDAVPEDKPIIFDDFYKVVEECVRRTGSGEPNIYDELLTVLRREQGIAISTTPYRWNTLMGQPPSATETETDLIEKAVAVKNDLLGHRLGLVDTPEASREHTDSVDDDEAVRSHEYTTFTRHLLEPETYEYRFLCYQDADDAKEKLNDAQAEYETTEITTDRIPSYSASVVFPDQTHSYTTHVPFVFFYFDRELFENLASEAEESVKVLGHVKGGAALGHRVKSLLATAFGAGGHGSSGAPVTTLLTLGMEATFGACLGLLVHFGFSTLQEEPEPRDHLENVLGSLTDLTPPQMELIEQELGLEPLTLEGFREWFTETGKRKELYRSVEENRDDLDRLQSEVELTDVSVFGEQDEETIRQLEQRIRQECTIQDIVDLRIDRAIQSPDRVLRSRLQSPARFLDQPVHETPDEWTVVDTSVANDLVATIREGTPAEQVAAVRDQDAVAGMTLHGPLGSGKTTAAYRAATDLTTEGYFVGVVNLSELTTVEFVLTQVDSPTLLVVDDFNDVSPRQVLTLLDLVARGVCRTVLFLIRSEEFEMIQAEMRDVLRTTGSEAHRLIWESAVDDHSFEQRGLHRDQLDALLSQNFSALTPTQREAIWKRCAVGDVANPLVSVVAADSLLTDGQLYTDDDVDLLVWDKIEPIFDASTWETEIDIGRALALTYVAAAQSLSTDTFESFLTEAPVTVTPTAVRRAVDEYLLERNDRLQIAPTFLRSLIVRRHCLGSAGVPLTESPYEIIDRFAGTPALTGLVRNLTQVYTTTADRDVQRRCVDYASEILEAAIEDERYVLSVRRFANAEMPIEPNAIEPDRVLPELEAPSGGSPPLLVETLSRLAMATDDTEQWHGTLTELVRGYADEHDVSAETTAEWVAENVPETEDG